MSYCFVIFSLMVSSTFMELTLQSAIVPSGAKSIRRGMELNIYTLPHAPFSSMSCSHGMFSSFIALRAAGRLSHSAMLMKRIFSSFTRGMA